MTGPARARRPVRFSDAAEPPAGLLLGSELLRLATAVQRTPAA